MVNDWKEQVGPDGWMGDVESASAKFGSEWVETLSNEIVDQMEKRFGRTYRI